MDCRKGSRGSPSCFPNIFGSVDLKSERSEEIDRQLSRDKLAYRRTYDVLIMGGEKSGKSTLLTKLQQIDGKHCDTNIKLQRDLIRKYVVHLMVDILTEMKKSPVRLNSLKNEAAARIILEVVKKSNFRYFDEFSTCTNVPNFVNVPNLIKILWSDPGLVKAVHGTRSYYKAEHFFGRIDEISEESYVPSSEDNDLCPISSAININEFFIESANSNYRFIDINSRLTRKIWIILLNRLKFERLIIVFVVDCSSYDIIKFDGDYVHTDLRNNLDLLRHLTSSCWFRNNTFFILLSKYDVFKKKILSGKKLEDYFPEYKNFTCASEESNEPLEVVRATCFIKNIIEKLAKFVDFRLWLPYQICDLNENDIRLFLNELADLTYTK